MTATPPPTGSAPTNTPAAQPNTGAGGSAPSQNSPNSVKGTPAATPAEIRKLKLKLDGREVEMSESEVIALAQQGKVATQRFQEAAKLRQEADQIFQWAKANPVEFFKRTGMNPRQWAEEYLLGEIQRESMSPEQKKAREVEEELKRYKTQEEQTKAAQKKALEEQKTKEFHDNYEKLFVTALNESGLPKTPFTIARMARLQKLNIKNGYELSASQLAKIVREDYVAEQKSILGGLDGDQLLEFLGPDLIKKFSKAQIAKLKARANSGGSGSSSGKAPVARNQPTPGLDWNEYQRRNRGKPPRQA